MTLRALEFEIGMDLMLERSGRKPISRSSQRPPVFSLHGFFIKIRCSLFRVSGLVTRVAVGRQRSQFTFRVVTGEARCVGERPRFERALVCLMAIVTGTGVLVFAMREKYAELRNKADSLSGCEKRLAKTRERISSRVLRSRFHVTVGTDLRNWSFARKELLPMATKAC